MTKLVLSSKASLSALYSPVENVAQLPLKNSDGSDLLTPGLIKNAHARGIRVYVWTINDRETMEKLIKMGIDGIVTDYPDRLLDVLNRN